MSAFGWDDGLCRIIKQNTTQLKAPVLRQRDRSAWGRVIFRTRGNGLQKLLGLRQINTLSFPPFQMGTHPLPQGKLQDCTRDRSHVRQGSVPMKGKLKVPGDSGRKAWSSHLHAQFGFFQKIKTHGILRGLCAVFLVYFRPKSYTHRHADTHRY